MVKYFKDGRASPQLVQGIGHPPAEASLHPPFGFCSVLPQQVIAQPKILLPEPCEVVVVLG